MTIDLKKLQKDVYRNKVEKGFNVTDIAMEFCRAHEELSEAFKKYNHNEEGVAEELADVAIFLLGMAEILGYDLEKEIAEKAEKNKKRVYERHGGSWIRVRTQDDP